MGDETAATITVRVIKSFSFKNFKSIIFPNLNLHTTNLAQLRKLVWDRRTPRHQCDHPRSKTITGASMRSSIDRRYPHHAQLEAV